jgi:SAM-dependent methyltransferase
MHAPLAAHADTASPSTLRVAGVWNQLWDHAPSQRKDDWLIERESRSPRWSAIAQRLLTAFGTIGGLRTIELGSGRGDLSVLLAQGGAKVTLLDISEKALVQARQRFERLRLPAEFIQADFHATESLPVNAFDVAVSSGVIEHFEEGERTRSVRAHLELLRAGGMTIISVPNARCAPYRLWKKYLELRGCWPYGVEIPYTRRELVSRIEQAGGVSEGVLGVGFWQSVGDHWVRNILKGRADWVDRRSILDSAFGMSLLAFARKPCGGACT